jgi:hypothetical protein
MPILRLGAANMRRPDDTPAIARTRRRVDRISPQMSVSGPKRTLASALLMSAFGGKADIEIVRGADDWRPLNEEFRESFVALRWH